MFSHGKMFLGFQFFMMETSVVTVDLLISPNSNQSFFCNLWKKPIISFCRHVYDGKSICCVLMEVVRDRNSKLKEDGGPPTKSLIHHRSLSTLIHHHLPSKWIRKIGPPACLCLKPVFVRQAWLASSSCQSGLVGHCKGMKVSWKELFYLFCLFAGLLGVMP